MCPEAAKRQAEVFLFVLWAGTQHLALAWGPAYLSPRSISSVLSRFSVLHWNSQAFLQAGLTVQNGGAGLGLAGGRSSEPAANRDLGRRRRAEPRRQPEPCQSPPGRAARPVGKVQRRSWGRGVRTGLTRVTEGGQ